MISATWVEAALEADDLYRDARLVGFQEQVLELSPHRGGPPATRASAASSMTTQRLGACCRVRTCSPHPDLDDFSIFCCGMSTRPSATAALAYSRGLQ